MTRAPLRPRSTLAALLLLWAGFYASAGLFTPPLLDDADSVHAEVAREMLLRHDYVTLYANGIRYLEKAPLLYWSMAASMKVLGVSAAAARVPLAVTMLALALLMEMFARELFKSARAGLYAGLMMLGSSGMFLFTRILIPDAMVCLWLAAAMYCFWRTESLEAEEHPHLLRLFCGGFAAACALNVLTKGLIGVVFPVVIVGVYLLLTRGTRRAWQRVGELHPWATLEAFLLIAAPWHVLAGWANPGEGQPAAFRFVNGHWLVPLPTDGNVRGWTWFYFMNEHLLRYLNLRVPHDYDTAPLWLFWGLCLVWLMPWSAFGFKAAGWAVPLRDKVWASQRRRHDFPLPERGPILVAVWAGVVLLFFSFSTRQEYYVLPALPAMAMLIAGWMSSRASTREAVEKRRRAMRRGVEVMLGLGAVVAAVAVFFLVQAKAPAAGTDLSTLLAQNPSDYALSLGHFLDLTGPAVAIFRWPLGLAGLSLLMGPLVARVFLRGQTPKTVSASLALAAGAFGFLISVQWGLVLFSPVLTSAQLARAIAPQVKAGDVVAIHGEYESGSTLGFYLRREDVHILEGRSSNLWYGSFFADAPKIFETPDSMAKLWAGPRRVFLWQSLTEEPRELPKLPGAVYILVKSGGKEIVSNQPSR